MEPLLSPPGRVSALVVDDEEVVASFVAELLADEGIDVDVALSGADALVRLEERAYDLLVLDKNLPDMSGLDLLGWVRGRVPSTRVVLVTAYGCIPSALAALQGGAADYILKPIDDVETFLERLRRAVSRPVPDGSAVAGLEASDLGSNLIEAIEKLRARMAATPVG